MCKSVVSTFVKLDLQADELASVHLGFGLSWFLHTRLWPLCVVVSVLYVYA